MMNWKRPKNAITVVRAVIDTSFWIDYGRGALAAAERERVEHFLRFGSAILCQLVWLELIVGYRSPTEQRMLRDYRATAQWEPLRAEDGMKSEGFAAILRGRGCHLGASDLLILAAADRLGAKLIHHDRDFVPVLALPQFAHLAP
jgi:predicted nucleic acid-binding protein